MFLNSRALFNILYILAFLFLVGLIIWMFTDIVLYVLISAIIASILRPVTDYIDNIEIFRVKIPRILAVFISFVLLATVPILFILLFVPLIIEQITVLQTLNFDALKDQLAIPIGSVEEFIISNFQPERPPGFIIEDIDKNTTSFIQGKQVRALLEYLFNFASRILVYALAITFITFFLLYEKGIIRRNILAIIPNAYFEVAVTTFYKIEKLLSNYLIGLLLQIFILFTIIAFGLTLLQVKYALTIAAFAAFINLIPYLGPFLGLVFGVFVVLSTGHPLLSFNEHLLLIVQMLPVFAVAQLMDNLLLQPIIFSKSVKAHPLEIFIIIFVGASLADILGMIAAIPVYTVLRVGFIELGKGYRQYYIFRSPQAPAGQRSISLDGSSKKRYF